MILELPSIRTSKPNSTHNTTSVLMLCLVACSVVSLGAGAYAQDDGRASWAPLTNLPHGGSVINMLLLTDGTVITQSGDDAQHWFKLTPDAHGSYVKGSGRRSRP